MNSLKPNISKYNSIYEAERIINNFLHNEYTLICDLFIEINILNPIIAIHG